jgi:hypothetical protein
MNLNAWQERLATHFAQLRDERVNRGVHASVYALEHGLSDVDLADVSREIHAFLQNSGPSRRHYLAWVVYSAEIGYQYSGEEYWDTFGRLTPNWDNSFRDQIRDSYYDFHLNFKATRPRGRWAEHFKIICWPITHAILPQDLQRELAQVLYELRGAFTLELLHDPDRLGKHILDAASNSGSRFRKFAEDHLLVGQISTALLLSDEERHSALILSTALDRITRDLDLNRKSRDWLSYARQRAQQVTIRGLSKSVTEYEAESILETSGSLTPRQRDVLELGLEPELFLVKTGAHAWAVLLKLPDLSRLIRRFPMLRDAVANQRCTIAGAEHRSFPKGYLLYGNQEVILARWPAPDEILIKFEQPQKELDYLLTAECLLRPGPTWLFKVLADGIARHIRTGVVQPGSSYLVVSREQSALSYSSNLKSTKIDVSCEGVRAARLDIPEVVSKTYSEELDSLHLHVAGGLEVSPVGLPAAKWDDAGFAEWLLTDQPLIRIAADFNVDGILLNLVGPCPAKMELQGPAWPLLVDLGKLDTGAYDLHVLVCRHDSESLISGHLQFMMREPRLWKGDTPRATPFSAHVSPATPTLEELWEGRVSIELVSPQKHRADCQIRFYASGSAALICERQLGPLELPCSATEWSEAWQKITSDKQIQNAYDASAECELIVDGEELGRFVLRALRESKPLRWIVKQENSRYFLRFEQLDDHASVVFSRYPFRSPSESSALSESPISGFRVSEDGGLFVASTDECSASVVIPPTIHSLKWLSADVIIPQGARSETRLSQLLRTLEVWVRSRSVGNPFAVERKAAVKTALTNEIIGLLCGDEWLNWESKYALNLIPLSDLKNFISPAPRHGPLGRDLVSKQPQLQARTVGEIVELLYKLCRSYLDLSVFSTARDHGVSRQEWAIEFAYRMFLNPEAIREWAQQDFVPGVGYLLKNSVLCRAARFTVLVSDTRYSNGTHLKAASI